MRHPGNADFSPLIKARIEREEGCRIDQLAPDYVKFLKHNRFIFGLFEVEDYAVPGE